MNRLVESLIVAVCLCAPAIATAQTAKDNAIRARQSSYFLMGQHMTRIGATVKGGAPFDKAALEASAELVEVMGRLVVDYYPSGSAAGTKAKADIWQETPRFTQMAQALQAEAAKLKAAVRAGNLDAIKAAYGATAKSCKTCHEAYKAP